MENAYAETTLVDRVSMGPYVSRSLGVLVGYIGYVRNRGERC